MISRRDMFPLAIAALAFAFLGLFLLYPLINVFSASFLDRAGTNFTLANYARMLSSSFYLGSLTNSLILGVLSTLLTIALGVPLAFCLGRLPIPGKSLLMALTSLPLVLPSFVAAYALVLLLGRAGIITRFLRDIGIPFTSLSQVSLLDHRVADHDLRFALGDQLAEIHHPDVIADVSDHLHIVLDQHHRQLTLEAEQQVNQPFGLLAADAGHRLVEQKQGRLHGERDGKLERALLAV